MITSADKIKEAQPYITDALQHFEEGDIVTELNCLNAAINILSIARDVARKEKEIQDIAKGKLKL